MPKGDEDEDEEEATTNHYSSILMAVDTHPMETNKGQLAHQRISLLTPTSVSNLASPPPCVPR